MHVPPTFLNFQFFIKLNKLGIVGRLLLSGTSLYIFSLKRKKWSQKIKNEDFFNVLSRRATIWVFSKKKLQFSQKRMCDSCLEAETISRAFSTRLRQGGTFLQKWASFTKKCEVSNFVYLLFFIKTFHYQRTSNITSASLNKNVQTQPLKGSPKIFFFTRQQHCTKNEVFH